MVEPDETRWFVSCEAVGGRRLRSARETKIFSSEEEARLYAKEMVLTERKNIIAGTLLSLQATRRIVSGQELQSWIAE
jgi:hypothetical protein